MHCAIRHENHAFFAMVGHFAADWLITGNRNTPKSAYLVHHTRGAAISAAGNA
jgi:hypothetical protein